MGSAAIRVRGFDRDCPCFPVGPEPEHFAHVEIVGAKSISRKSRLSRGRSIRL
jgi:hypothetical protein